MPDRILLCIEDTLLKCFQKHAFSFLRFIWNEQVIKFTESNDYILKNIPKIIVLVILLEYPAILILTLIPNLNPNHNPITYHNPNPHKDGRIF